MIGQPLGCLLVLLTGAISFAASIFLLWLANFLRPGLFAWTAGDLWAAFGIGFVLFFPLMDLGHKLEIRMFFRKHGVKILRIRGFKNHYRIDYEKGGKKDSGKWPEDFHAWAKGQS